MPNYDQAWVLQVDDDAPQLLTPNTTNDWFVTVATATAGPTWSLPLPPNGLAFTKLLLAPAGTQPDGTTSATVTYLLP